MAEPDYDVIIIGGRCAGASLALRLADTGLRILLLDRATFPSLPNVPSSPFVHPGTVGLLDELGLSVEDYTHPGSTVDHFIVHIVGFFDAPVPTSLLGQEQHLFYGIDRSRFDTALWERAAAAPGVTARQGVAVTKVLKDAQGTVTGVECKSGDESETITADLVVGADGRFSLAAREFGAPVLEARNDHTNAVYYADWENAEDYSADYPQAITTYSARMPLMFLVIPYAERSYQVGMVMPSQDAQFGPQAVEQAYVDAIARVPHLAERLKNARRATDVLGMRPIENGYRQAYGAGWALVGDALHYKDPSDGQGIYDALLGSKLLAKAILDWKQRGVSWAEAGAGYQQRFKDATYAIFESIVQRSKPSPLSMMPPFIVRTFGRYLTHDLDFQIMFLRFLARSDAPGGLNMGPRMMLRVLVQGILGDLRGA